MSWIWANYQQVDHGYGYHFWWSGLKHRQYIYIIVLFTNTFCFNIPIFQISYVCWQLCHTKGLFNFIFRFILIALKIGSKLLGFFHILFVFLDLPTLCWFGFEKKESIKALVLKVHNRFKTKWHRLGCLTTLNFRIREKRGKGLGGLKILIVVVGRWTQSRAYFTLMATCRTTIFSAVRAS